MTPLRRDFAAVVAIAAAAALVGTFTSEGSQYFIANLLIIGMFAAAFDLAYGRAGIFSMGHAAFFGSGAYGYALLTLKAGFGFLPALAGAAVFGGMLATIFGVLAIRASGIYFALSTIAMGQLVAVVIEAKLRFLSGGGDGLPGVPRPMLLGIDMSATDRYLWLVCLAFTIQLGLLALIRSSPYGLVLSAIRDNPVRAEQLGYNVSFYRVSAYAISGTASGMAGAYFAALTMFVGPDMLKWMMSGEVLIMTVLGGPGTLFGPLLGVAAFETARSVVSRYTDHWFGFVGVLFILVTLFLPAGLVGLWPALRSAFFARRNGRSQSAEIK
ncbi:MAG: branched-chain amino acid ABC transporter permease [Pseudomonadota bacterium]